MILDRFCKRFLKMKFKSIIEHYKIHGLWNTLIYQLKAFIYYGSITIIFFELDLENSDFQNNEENSELIFVKLHHEDFLKSKFNGWEISENEALKRFQKRYILFAAVKNNILVSQNWSEPNKADVWGLKLRIDLPKSTIYTSRLYTIPEYRGKGLAKITKLYMLKTLKEYGYKKAFIIISEANKVSQAVNKKFGFKPYQKVNYHRFFYFLKLYIVREYDTPRKNRIFKIRKTDKIIWDMFSKYR